jgi:uncharacterized membrane-anchored protein YitT (DUF2179 family)
VFKNKSGAASCVVRTHYLAPAHSSAKLRSMSKPLPLVAALLGVVFLALAVVYFLIPAGSLPSVLPGFEAGSEHIHSKHAIVSLIVALALFAFAWFQRARLT